MSDINDISANIMSILNKNSSSESQELAKMPEASSFFDSMANKEEENFSPDPYSNRKIDPSFLDEESDYDKYGKILDNFTWEPENAAEVITNIPERFFKSIREVASAYKFGVIHDQDKGAYIVVARCPDVFCMGEPMVFTVNNMHKKTARKTTRGRGFHIDLKARVCHDPVGFMCQGRSNPEDKSKNCQYDICPLDVSTYVAYLMAFGQKETLESYRAEYQKNKDKIDLDENSPWYSLTKSAEFVFSPFGRGYYVPEDKLVSARKMLDEGIYSSSFDIDKAQGMVINAWYDGTYRRMNVTDFGERNDVQPFEDLIVERRPAETISRRQSVSEKQVAEAKLASAHDFRQFSPCPYCDNEFCEIKYAAFADMLIQSGNYETYLCKTREHKRKHDEEFAKYTREIPRLSEIKDAIRVQNSFYGCVTSNSENYAMKIARLVADEVTYRPGVSPNVARMTLFEFMNELRSNVYYKKITDYNTEIWGKPANNQIYILNGIDEFLKIIAMPEGKEMGMRIVEHLVHVKDNKYFILVGTKTEIDNLFNEFTGISNVFSLGRIELEDMTAVEIYDSFYNMLSDHLKAAVTEDFKSKAIDYIALNQGVLPYNNKEMAVYLSAYVNQHGLRLPKLQHLDVEKMLSEIIGMDDIKQKLKDFEAYTKYKKMVKGQGAKVPSANTHMVFLGNPGTGKTTIARIVAQMMFNIGLLRKNSVIEVQRKDLIAEYVGHTAIKTQEVIDKAMGGVLFIDEAYSLTEGGSKGDFGGECIATLIKAMEDHKDDLIVIFAGYVDEMGRFMESNPGLQSRVGYVFNFKDYEVEELVQIFRMKMKSNGYSIEDGVDEKVGELCRYFKEAGDFGNGRFVDNIIQQTLVRHAQKANDDNLILIGPDDIPEIEDVLKTSLGGWDMVNPKDISEEELKMIAVHELGHALAGYYLSGDMEIEKISVQADASGTLGFVKYERKKKALVNENDLMNNLAVTLSGKNAEELIYHTHSSGCSNDIQKATALAKRMVSDYAMGNWLEENAHIDLLKEAEKMSKSVLEEHKDKLTGLADDLVARGSITKEEIEAFLN